MEPAIHVIYRDGPTRIEELKAGSILHGMMHKAEKGQLNLDRSLWKLRRHQWRPHSGGLH
jgi:hypothetical protein